MTQYHYLKVNSKAPSSFDMPSTSLPCIQSNSHQYRNSWNPVCHNNGQTPISLAGPSFINASPINNIKLPSIKELDNMIISTAPTNQPIASVTDTVPQLPPIMSTAKRPFSIISERDARTNRPLKRQNKESKKLKASHSKQQCHSCNSTETPEWRKGPLGPRTLCNACGLIWTKLCKQNEEDNQSKTSSSDTHLSSMPSPTSSHASSSTFASSNNSNKSNSNCQKHTLSFLLS